MDSSSASAAERSAEPYRPRTGLIDFDHIPTISELFPTLAGGIPGIEYLIVHAGRTHMAAAGQSERTTQRFWVETKDGKRVGKMETVVERDEEPWFPTRDVMPFTINGVPCTLLSRGLPLKSLNPGDVQCIVYVDKFVLQESGLAPETEPKPKSETEPKKSA